jgi:superfamily II DNA/RNA helicase
MADIPLPSSEDSDKYLLDLVNDTDSESLDSEDSDSEDAVQQNVELTGDDEGDNAWIFDRKNMQISEIRESQAKVLSLLYKEKSVLLLARTGWGKSLIFQGLFHMQLKIEKTARFITIIFVPLSGLGQE